jgi:hypothetical protein
LAPVKSKAPGADLLPLFTENSILHNHVEQASFAVMVLSNRIPETFDPDLANAGEVASTLMSVAMNRLIQPFLDLG